MARVTVEDCLEKVDNRFKLVLLASKRAGQLLKGADALVEADNDKPVVLALREVASGAIDERSVNKAASSSDIFAQTEETTLA